MIIHKTSKNEQTKQMGEGGGGWREWHKVEKPGYEYTQASSQS